MCIKIGDELRGKNENDKFAYWKPPPRDKQLKTMEN